MELDLISVATIVQEAGRIAVRDEMDARDRYNPWETSEAWLRITIAQRLRRMCRLPGSPRYRVHDEYPEKNITNMRSTHPIDIVVLHPLLDGKNPWAYCPPLGIIEIKRNFQNLKKDGNLLNRITQLRVSNPPLLWVLQIVFINGTNKDVIAANEHRVRDILQTLPIRLLANQAVG